MYKNNISSGKGGNKNDDRTKSYPANKSYNPYPSMPSAMSMLPKSSQDKMKTLMEMVEKDDQIKWDKFGEVSINGNPLKGSHIYDLAREVTVVKPKTKIGKNGRTVKIPKTAPPPGFSEFTKSLVDLGYPRSLFFNKSRRSDVYKTIDTKRSGAGKRSNEFPPIHHPGAAKTRIYPVKLLDKFIGADFGFETK